MGLNKIITIASGKGGVGKSFIASNLSYLLSKHNKVLLWDANLNFPNLHLMLGVDPPVRLDFVLENNLDISTALFEVKENLFLLSDSPLSEESHEIKLKFFDEIVKEIKTLDFDYLIIDTMPGAHDIVLTSCIISDIVLMVATDEPTSIIDSYSLIKLLQPFVDEEKIKLLINDVIDEEDYNEILDKINSVTDKFLDFKYESLGFIPYDRDVKKSIRMQTILSEKNPDSECVKVIDSLTYSLHKKLSENIDELENG